MNACSRFSRESAGINLSLQLPCSRIFASLIAGLALGVVGYTGWSGFLWYIVAQLVVRMRCACPKTPTDSCACCAELCGHIMSLRRPLTFRYGGYR